jgi:ADP-heptose:LPS heptosyltransferase
MRPCVELHAEPDMQNCETCRRYYTDERARRAMDEMARRRQPCEYFGDTPLVRGEDCCPRKWRHPCDLYGACVRDDAQNKDNLPSCTMCIHHTPRGQAVAHAPQKVVLVDRHAPGDAVVLSAAIESLHMAYPGRYITDVQSAGQAMWQFNPHVRSFTPDETTKIIKLRYELIQQSNQRPLHFMEAYCDSVGAALGVNLPCLVNTPRLYLSHEEMGWASQVQELTGSATPYMIVNAGYKSDFTAKFWGASNYQAVVDRLRGKVLFVQIGSLEATHTHAPLNHVVDLRGQTDVRQLMRLVHNSRGGLGPSTFLQHLCAAFGKPYALLAGAREPTIWQAYPRQIMFSTVGQLPCCNNGACWLSRTVALNDNVGGHIKCAACGKQNYNQKLEEFVCEQCNATKGQWGLMDESLCKRPVVSQNEFVPQCLDMIRPEQVADAALNAYQLGER